MCHAYSGKKFRIFVQAVLRVPKQLKMSTLEVVFVIMLQLKVPLKRHKFGQWESFLGLVNIPSMCLS